jgi:hypothetical protein
MNRLAKRTVATILLATAFGLSTPATTYAEGAGDPAWVTLRREDGILVSQKSVPGSPFVALRGEGNVPEPPLLVGSVVVDVPDTSKWVDNVAEARVIRWISANEYVAYTHVGTPLSVADREFVTDVKIDVDPEAKRVVIRIHSVDDPAAPKPHYVRGEIQESTLFLTSTDGGRATHVVAELHADPKGGLPPFIVNMFQKNWGYNTLEGLRARAAKRETPVVPWLRTLLASSDYYGASTSPVARADVH